MKLFRNLLVIGTSLSLATASHAQVKVQTKPDHEIPYLKNEVGLEVGGNSLIYSAYYQRAIFRKNNIQFNVRIGGSFIPGIGNYTESNAAYRHLNVISYIVPNVLFFRKRHAWEIGLGANLFASFEKYSYKNNASDNYHENMQNYMLTPQIGYRAYLKNSKFYFRTAISTFFLVHSHDSAYEDVDVEPKVLPWGAVGFGYAFGKK